MSEAGKLYALAERCETADGLLVGEMAARLLREARSLVWPQPPARVPTRQDGSPWGGDGVGPYSEPYKEWGRITEPLETMINAGAFLNAAKAFLVPHTLWAVGSMEDGPFARLCWPMADGTYSGGYFEATAATAELALLAAALKARASQAVETAPA